MATKSHKKIAPPNTGCVAPIGAQETLAFTLSFFCDFSWLTGLEKSKAHLRTVILSC